MKFKFLSIIVAVLTLGACNYDAPETSSAASSQPAASSSYTPVWEYTDFISDTNNARFDIFDFEEGLQVSYGNAALVAGTNNTVLNDNSIFSVNKNLDHEKSFNALIVAEKNTGGVHNGYHQAYLGTEGDSITSLFNLIKNVLVGYERAYVAFSLGTPAKWTTGLNAKVDEYFTSLVNPEA